MNRSMVISQEFLFGPAEVVAELSAEEIATLALELTLLLQSMASGVRLRCPRGGKIDIVLGSSEISTVADKSAASHVRFQLGRHPAGYIQAVLLRAYRDKMPEVNHIHVDGQCGDRPMALTFLFSSSGS